MTDERVAELLAALRGVMDLAERRRGHLPDEHYATDARNYISTVGPHFQRLERAWRAYNGEPK